MRNNAVKILVALKNINDVLGVMDFEVNVSQERINELIHKRNAAREARNWQEADAYRAQLAEFGVEILDTPRGVIWQYKK